MCTIQRPPQTQCQEIRFPIRMVLNLKLAWEYHLQLKKKKDYLLFHCWIILKYLNMFKQLIHQSFTVLLLPGKKKNGYTWQLQKCECHYSVFCTVCSSVIHLVCTLPIKAENHSLTCFSRTVPLRQLHRERLASRGLSRFAFWLNSESAAVSTTTWKDSCCIGKKITL